MFATLYFLCFNGEGSASSDGDGNGDEDTPSVTLTDIQTAVNALKLEIRNPTKRREMRQKFRTFRRKLIGLKNKCYSQSNSNQKRMSSEDFESSDRLRQDDSMADAPTATDAPTVTDAIIGTIDDIAAVIKDANTDIRRLRGPMENNFRLVDGNVTGVTNECYYGPNRMLDEGSALLHRQLQDDSSADAKNPQTVAKADIAPAVNGVRTNIRNLGNYMETKFNSITASLTELKNHCDFLRNFNRKRRNAEKSFTRKRRNAEESFASLIGATHPPIVTLADIVPVVNDLKDDVQMLWRIMDSKFQSLNNFLPGVTRSCVRNDRTSIFDIHEKIGVNLD